MSAAQILAKIRADLGDKANGGFGGLGGVGSVAETFASEGTGAGASGSGDRAPTLRLDWPELDALLPDGALPAGVVELSSRALVASAIAARAVRAGQNREAEAWCAWVDPEGTLYAPGLAAAGIDLARLLVARPDRHELGRVALKMAQSGAFDLLVIDMDAAPGASFVQKNKGTKDASRAASRGARKKAAWPSEVLVRKLALAVEDGKTHVLLLTDCRQPRVTSWPVGMRLDVARGANEWQIAVGKERRGRVGRTGSIPLLNHQVSHAAALAKTSAPSRGEASNVIVPDIWERKQTG